MRRALLSLALALGCAAAPPPALRVALPASEIGGERARAFARAVLAPFTRTSGQRVHIVPLPPPASLSPPLGWDVALLDPIASARLCTAGTIRKIDRARLGAHATLMPGAVGACGVGASIAATVLTWDTGKLHAAPPAPPPDWAAFWDVARTPGRRGLRASPIGTLEIALLADGVPPRDIYTVLRGTDGQDRAFRKLDQLRPYIAWWRTQAEPMAMLQAGKVLMTAAPAERVLAQNARAPHPFGLQSHGALAAVQSWAIAAASPVPDRAITLIDIATAPASPPAAPPLHLDDAVVQDGAFWRDHGPALTARFNTWLAH